MSNIVFLTILVVFSGVATLAQVLFQISLATPYKDELNRSCKFIAPDQIGRQRVQACCVVSAGDNVESIWRQFGFVL